MQTERTDFMTTIIANNSDHLKGIIFPRFDAIRINMNSVLTLFIPIRKQSKFISYSLARIELDTLETKP